jgi:hypothetical protein
MAATKKRAVKSAKQITQVKKAVPAIKKATAKKAAPKPSVRPPIKGKKPATAGKDMTRMGPGPRPGSQSIPFQGPGPQGSGVF